MASSPFLDPTPVKFISTPGKSKMGTVLFLGRFRLYFSILGTVPFLLFSGPESAYNFRIMLHGPLVYIVALFDGASCGFNKFLTYF
jgi:hypothetical protein